MEERKNSDLGLQLQNITKSMDNEPSFTNLELNTNINLKENISLISKFLFKKVFEPNFKEATFDEMFKLCEKQNKKFVAVFTVRMHNKI